MDMRTDDRRQTYLEVLQRRLDVQAVLVLPNPDLLVPYREGNFYLVVVNQPQADEKIRRMLFQDQLIVEQQISTWQLETGAVHGLDERLAAILGKAEIVLDKDGYMKRMKERLRCLPESVQKRFICKEYSRLLRFFHETKECLQQGMALDAYHGCIESLHSCAKIIVYEAGEQPLAALWSQVKQIDPSVYKLYEELCNNAEALDKRIELLVLAIEFWITSRMKEAVRFLVDIMETKTGPWRLQELMCHPQLQQADIEIPLLLEKMAQRSLVKEVVCSEREHGEKEIGYILLG